MLAARLAQFNHENVLGSIIGWYTSSIFAKQPTILKKPSTEKSSVAKTGAIPSTEAPGLPKVQADFFSSFERNCDRTGTKFIDKCKAILETLLVYEWAYVLTDLPPARAYSSLAEQQAAGALDPFLIVYDPSCVINWGSDDAGNMEWAMLRISSSVTAPLTKNSKRDTWYLYTATDVMAWSCDYEHGAEKRDGDVRAVDGYPRRHALSDKNRIPIRRFSIPDGLWLGDRIYLPLKAHLNLENALDWQITQSALSMLAIFGNFDEKTLTKSEIGFLLFEPGTDAKYLEPEGRSMQIHVARIDQMKEEMYRLCYLLSQARNTKATPAAQSGISKEQDMVPAKDTQEALGGILKAAMTAILEDVSLVRGFPVMFDVRGFEFADRAGIETIDMITATKTLDIQSDTLDRELDKMAADAAIPDAMPDVKVMIRQEIDKGPSKSEREAILQQQALQKFTDGLTAQIAN